MTPTKNALYVISPYKIEGQWVFDDSSKGLEREPLVCGADILCSQLFKKYGDFNLIFSDNKLPKFDFHLKKHTSKTDLDMTNGTWYKVAGSDLDVWLCPALFRYYDKAPENLYIKGNSKNES
tara:strand:- start:1202 stop:1567 length:366 start_codon:yes stop_codon:yes gene_type:complete